jgi:hypothetical protein
VPGCLSVHHHDDGVNNRVLALEAKPSTAEITAHLQSIGLSFRINATLQRSGISSVEDLVTYVQWAAALHPQDLYIRELFSFASRITFPQSPSRPIEYCHQHHVSAFRIVQQLKNVKEFSGGACRAGGKGH